MRQQSVENWTWFNTAARYPNTFSSPECIEAFRTSFPSEAQSLRMETVRSDAGDWLMCTHTMTGRFWEKFGVLSLLSHPYLPFSSPISNYADDVELWAGLIDAYPEADVLVLPSVRFDPADLPAINARFQSMGASLETIKLWSRACLHATGNPDKVLQAGLGTKKAKQIRRLRRRLEDDAPVHFAHHMERNDITSALETFMDLEASGWKGKAGTALRSSPATTDFARTLASGLVERQAIRIDELVWGDRVIASLVSLQEGSHVWAWKIAYDETLSRFSPGFLLMTEVTRTFISDPGVSYADSCADANHPMIDRIWRDRQPMADLVIGTRPSARLKAKLIASARRSRHGLKAIVLANPQLKALMRRVRSGG